MSRQWISLVERGKVHIDLGLVFDTLEALGYQLSIDRRLSTAGEEPSLLPSEHLHAPGRTVLTIGKAPLGVKSRHRTTTAGRRKNDG